MDYRENLIVLFFFPWDFGKHANWKSIKTKKRPPPQCVCGRVKEAVRLAGSAQSTQEYFLSSSAETPFGEL